MADDTADGGDAPRSASLRDRSGGKRRWGGPPATVLEIHPTIHDAPIDPDIESDAESDAAIAAIAADPTPPQNCPSCAMPMVAGAVFCGECGTRAVAVVPATILLDAEVPSEPLPAPSTGSFDMAAALVGAASSPGVADTDAAKIVDADDLAEESESETVRVAAVDDEPVEHEESDDEPVEDNRSMIAAMPVAAGVVATGIMAGNGAAAAAEMPPAPPIGVGPAVNAVAPPEASPAYAGSVAGGGDDTTRGSGSKKGVWVAVAAAVVLIIGVVGGFALTSGSSSSKKDNQVVAGSSASTTTVAPTTQSTVTASTDAPVTTETTLSTDGQVTPTTVKVTPTTSGFNPAPPPPTPAPPTTQGSALVQAYCPGGATSGHIGLTNTGTAAGSFRISTSNSFVAVSPASGSVPPGGSVIVSFIVSPGAPDGRTFVSMLLAGTGPQQCGVINKG